MIVIGVIMLIITAVKIVAPINKINNPNEDADNK